MRLIQIIKNFISIKKNVSYLIILSAVVALSQFFVYALINKTLGKEYLGIWSLVAAATSIGQIGNFGLSSSLVRYLPEMILKQQKFLIQKMIGTVHSATFFMVLPVLILLYFPAAYYGRVLLNEFQFDIFRQVLLIAMCALFLNNLSIVYSFALDSLQKHYLRSAVQISGWILFLIWSFILLPYYSLYGVAIAMLIQHLFQLIALLIVFRQTQTIKLFFPLAFDKQLFKKIYSFGISSQAISFISFFFDPLIKYFITQKMGLAITANYEVANKIAIQLRNLLVAANQVILPKVVIHKANGTLVRFLQNAISRNNLLAVATGMINILMAPVAVYFFSIQFDWILLQAIIILTFGWTVNALTSIHYYSAMAIDKIGQLVISHLIQSFIILILYLLIPENAAIAFYFVIPSLALFVGSIYNAYIFRGRGQNSCSWIKSGYFLYFIFSSLIVVICAPLSEGLVFFVAVTLFAIYIFAIINKFRRLQDFKELLDHL